MPEPEPKPIECSEAGYVRQGDECVAVECEDYVGNPCHEKTKLGNPDVAEEEIIPVDEEKVLEDEELEEIEEPEEEEPEEPEEEEPEEQQEQEQEQEEGKTE